MRRSWALALAMLAGGCARFMPLPLTAAASPGHALPEIPTAPLTVDQVAELAVRRSPDLLAARAKRGVADAQLIRAAVLPNPSVAGALLPLISGVGVAPAWNIGISQDIKALIVYRPKRRAAKAALGQVDADLLWQEWQVAGQARALAVNLIFDDRAIAQLQAAFDLLAKRNAQVQRALAARDVTLVTAAPDATAYQSAHARLLGAEEHRLEQRHQLDALLGLAPDLVVPLSSQIDLPAFNPVAIRGTLPELPDRRPDLLALRLGYAAANEDLRAQILSQFPDLVLGGSATRDSSKVLNIGPEATIGLPVFDRNQGNIAVARATRVQLRAEYAARLASVIGEVGALLSEHQAFADQLATVRADLPRAKLAADRAAQAFGRSALDERSYVDLVTTYFSKEQEIMTLETALADREVAIDTLVGAGLPTIATVPAMTGTSQ